MRTILSGLMMMGSVMLATGEGFEAPEVQVGTVLPEFWQGNGTVSADESATGTQSLKVGPENQVSYGARPEAGIAFVDLQILPVTGTSEVLNIQGARIGFDAAGKIRVFEADQAEGRLVQNVGYEVAEGVAAAWVRVTVRIDMDKKTWDLFVDGKPAEANLALGNATAALILHGATAGPVYLDDYTQTEENPLFPDADQDGMADAEEKANGLNPYGDDRDGDLDGDGISNVEEMFAGTSPRAPGSLSDQVAQLIYVDNLNGSDSYTGKRSYTAIGQDGPKASLKAAMAAAPSGSVIVILKGKGIYDEGSRGVAGKQLTIRPVDPVTIR
jgi:hypothetical protein